MMMQDDFKDDSFDLDDDEDGFEDFDSSNQKSLGDLWRNSPLVKIAIILAVLAVLAGGFVFITSGPEEEDQSVVTQAVQEREVPGEEAPRAYTEAIERQNRERAESALRTGTESAIPTPVYSDNQRLLETLEEIEEEPETQEAVDPFEAWRNQEFERKVEEERVQLQQEQDQFIQQFDQALDLQPDPEAVSALSNAMLLQMEAVLDAQSLSPINVTNVTTDDYYRQQRREIAQQNLQMQQQQAQRDYEEEQERIEISDEDIIIPAGSLVYAQLITEANTDTPGPVLAQILEGELLGARAIGQFDNTERYITISFNRASLGRTSYTIDAVALDPNTSLTGMQTEYNPRYFQRAILPAAARFLEGIGEAIAEDTSVTVSTEGGTTTTTQQNLDVGQELGAGLEEGAQEVGDILDEQADEVEPLIRVAAGTPMVLFFLDDVLDPTLQRRIDALSNERETSVMRTNTNFDPLNIPGAPPLPTVNDMMNE